MNLHFQQNGTHWAKGQQILEFNIGNMSKREVFDINNQEVSLISRGKRIKIKKYLLILITLARKGLLIKPFHFLI